MKVKLGEIVGKVISGEWGNDDEIGNGIPVLRTTNFTNDGMIDFTNVVTRSITKKDISSKYLQTGDIIIEKSGGSDKQPVGRVVYFEGTSNTYLFNNFTGLLRIKDSLQWDSKYLFYTLFANYLKGGTLQYQNKTTGLHNLKTEQFVKNFEVNKIDIMEQRHIAAVLDKVSDLIALRKKQLAKLDELVKARFVEMFGDPVLNPMGWNKIVLSKVILMSNNGMARRGNNVDGNIVLRLVELQDGFIDYIKPNRIILSEAEKKKYLLFEKDVLFARVNGNPENVGRCAVFCDMGEPIYHNDHIIRVHFDENYLDSIFVVFLLNSNYGKNQIKKYLKTSAGQYTISQNGIGSIIIILPPLDLQQKFAKFVEKVENQKTKIKQSLEILETLKKSLMQEYFG